MLMGTVRVLVICMLLMQGSAMQGLCKMPTTRPLLMLEPGTHTAAIKAIASDGSGKYVVTASDDKTVRVWSSDNGKLVRVIRPPIGEGNEGKLYAVAMSPDGCVIACGGWTGWEWDGNASLYLFDCATGRMLRRLDGFPEVIKSLAWSPDGRHLAVGLGGGKGLYVIRASDWVLEAMDRMYRGDCTAAVFDSDGRLSTASWDGFLRLYGKDFRLCASRRVLGGERPYSIAFSPDGARIAVGSMDTAKFVIVSGRDLSILPSPPVTGGRNEGIFCLAWSIDGTYLYGAGSFQNKNGFLLRRWKPGDEASTVDIPLADGVVTHLLALPDGRLAFADAMPAFGILGTNEGLIAYSESVSGEFIGPGTDLTVSPDGSVIGLSSPGLGAMPAVFSLGERVLSDAGNRTSPNLTSPVTSVPRMNVSGWRNGSKPLIDGNFLVLEQGEYSRCLAFLPGGDGFLFGTDWHLRLFSRKGREQWRIATPGPVWAVNVADNGRLAVAALGDGTVRWYRTSDGKELLAMFAHKDHLRWVAWTPSGYFDAAPGADSLIGWQMNGGKGEEARFFPLARFRGGYYRPDVVGRVLVALDEQEALQSANLDRGKDAPTQVPVPSTLPPVVTIISPRDGELADGKEIAVNFTISSPSGEPVTGFRALVDGRPAWKGAAIPAGLKSGTNLIVVPVPERDCEISVIAENRFSASEPARVRIARKKSGVPEEFSFFPKLYLLAIGVGAYHDKGLALDYAAKDARDIASVFEKQKGGLYRDVVTRLLTDEGATRDGILDGLDWLQREVTARDVAVLFVSGHGITDQNGGYYFLPVNADTEKLKRSGIVFSEIRNTLSTIAGKTVLFVDTCHSGGIMGKRKGMVDVNAIASELAGAENGVVVFTSSTGRQYSLEDPEWRNGAFTRALLEGLSGKADVLGKGKITVSMLEFYLSERVKELTGGKQTPTTAKPVTVQDFPLAVTMSEGLGH
jgi:WD40 repeat protein